MKVELAQEVLVFFILVASVGGAVMWSLVSEFLKISPPASRHFLATNLMLALCVALVLMREPAALAGWGPAASLAMGVPAWVSWPVANGLAIALLAVLGRGLRRLFKVQRRTWLDGTLLGGAWLAFALLPAGSGSATHYAMVFSAVASLLLLSMARDVWHGIAGALGPRVGMVMAAPLVLGAALIASQPMRLPSGGTTNLTATDPTTLWGLLLLALGLNVCSLLLVLARLLAVLRVRAERDHLTQLYNRRRFEEFLDHEWRRVQRHASELCLVLLDIDHFKRINDSLGHEAGDAALQQAAKGLAAACRDSDVIARYGGEEFAVLLPETPLEGALVQAERLRECLAQSGFTHAGVRHPLTVSLGVACSRGESSLTRLMQRADHAMYAAKAAGRNCVRAADLSSPTAE